LSRHSAFGRNNSLAIHVSTTHTIAAISPSPITRRLPSRLRSDLRPRCPRVSLSQHKPTPDSHWPFNVICNARVLRHALSARTKNLHSALRQCRPNVGELLETRAWTLAHQRARSHPPYRAFKPVPTCSLHDTLSYHACFVEIQRVGIGDIRQCPESEIQYTLQRGQ
jgi:hypothetical protein